ncbi:hypothetical protein Pelo_17553 [Pelomyxa schiedti]|nr:hypothetical protein Pelo_17553 [Pelomyxa schiedti]
MGEGKVCTSNVGRESSTEREHIGEWPHSVLKTAEGEYEGDLKGTKRHGTGTMLYPHRSSYAGEWANDKRHGHGIFRHEDTTYEGAWVNGMKEGNGTMKWRDGATYTGDWHRDQRHGQGVMQVGLEKKSGMPRDFDSIYVYDGEWHHDKKHGKGTRKYNRGKPTLDRGKMANPMGMES